MNPSGAYQGEMENLFKIGEEKFDRILAGKAPPAANGAQGQLSELIQSLQTEYLQAPEDAVQARHFAQIAKASQLITDKGDPATEPASKAQGPNRASGLPKLRRKVMLSGIFASLAAKLAAASMVAVGATGGLAAADLLPQPAQDAVAVVAAPVVDLPDSAEERAEEARQAAQERRAKSELVLEESEAVLEEIKVLADQGCVAAQEFGKSTAEAAKQGTVDGKAISEQARALGEQCRQDAGNRQDGEQAEDAGSRQDAGRRPAGVPAGRPEGAGSAPGQGSVPEGAGSQSSIGIGQANNTPAQSYTPDQVPAGPSTADQYRPQNVPAPAGPRGGRP